MYHYMIIMYLIAVLYEFILICQEFQAMMLRECFSDAKFGEIYTVASHKGISLTADSNNKLGSKTTRDEYFSS